MKKTWIVVTILLIFFLLLFPAESAQACMQGMTLFIQNVLPSLLPFMIAGGILSRLGFAAVLSRLCAPVFSTLFCLPGEAAFVFVCGVLCGNPVGAQAAGDLCAQQVLSPHQAQRAAALSAFVSPAFLFGALGVSMLAGASHAVPVAVGHYLGAICSGVLWSIPERKDPSKSIKKVRPAVQNTETVPMRALIDTVIATARTLPMICIWICLFAVALRFLERLGLFSLVSQAAGAFHLHTQAASALFSGFLEMTNGCARLCSTEFSSPELRAALLSAVLSFGGLCVFFQNAAFLQQHGIHMRAILLSRITHAIFAFVAALAFCRLFPFL